MKNRSLLLWTITASLLCLLSTQVFAKSDTQKDDTEKHNKTIILLNNTWHDGVTIFFKLKKVDHSEYMRKERVNTGERKEISWNRKDRITEIIVCESIDNDVVYDSSKLRLDDPSISCMKRKTNKYGDIVEDYLSTYKATESDINKLNHYDKGTPPTLRLIHFNSSTLIKIDTPK